MAKTPVYEMRIVKCGFVKEPEYGDSKITSPREIADWASPWRSQPQEHVVCYSLDSAGRIITSRVVTIGLMNHSLVHPREVFRGAILDNAASVIVAHNHPSGSLEPSGQDIAITVQLKESGQILGIPLIDHVIVTTGGFWSMREHGQL